MNKRVFGIFLGVILLLIIVISSDLVSAVSFTEGVDQIKDFVTNLFDLNVANGGGIFTQFLIFVIVSLFVFSLLDVTGFFNNKGILFVVSFVVGLLSTYYMTQTQLFAIQDFYTAFGGALVTLVPFLILSAFTYRAIADGNVQLMVMQHVAWGVFALFLVYSIIINWGIGGAANSVLSWVFLVIALALTVLNSWALDFFGARIIKAKGVKVAKSMSDIERGVKLFKKTGEDLSE
ncbi:MAG: hypothetical protein ABIA78_01085 [archaeon]